MKKSLFSAVLILSLLMAMIPLPTHAESKTNYLERVSFFGDSTTYGLIRYIAENDGHLGKPVAKLTRDQILEPPDGTFYLRNLPTAKIRYQGRDLPLAEAFRQASPDILIMTVGINGLPTWTETEFLSYYRRLLDLIGTASPSTQIVLQSVYPTAKERDRKLVAFTVDKIDRLNGWIKDLAKERSLPYLDTASVLKGADGWLIPSYHNGDGMHLNTQGFNRVLTYIADYPIKKGS
ncbi:MAG: SGNH/GDSL hydrolase family protein [Clostridia bacterium]|nr:SGNH/GDSL hydrolase family protein [Clostridia bacterium]